MFVWVTAADYQVRHTGKVSLHWQGLAGQARRSFYGILLNATLFLRSKGQFKGNERPKPQDP